MTNQRIIIPVKGMHCTACEVLTERELANLPGVTKVKSSHQSGQIELEYSDQEPNLIAIKEAVNKAGYQYGQEDLALISKNANDYSEFLYAVIIFLGLYWLLSATGLLSLGSNSFGSGVTWPVILMVGLTAGFSSCMALVGGLVLGLSASFAKANPQLSASKKFAPHLIFNLGRISGYALLGAVLGAVGSVFKLSVSFNGYLIIVVALVMMALGLKLIKLFPILERFNIALPKSVAKLIPFNSKEKSYSHYRTAILGALTFFVPCGFTQAMQVYALSSGSAWTGALTMGLFALGTAPGLLSLAGLVALIKGKASGIFFRLAGLAVLAFAVFNLSNGYNLVKTGGIDLLAWAHSNTASVKTINNSNTVVDGVQIITMTQSARGYSPKKLTVKVNQPVKWIITSTNARTCASALVVPKLNISKQLEQGENIIEFTPSEVGSINYSCSMGMYTGVIEVVDDLENSSSVDGQDRQSAVPMTTEAVDTVVLAEAGQDASVPVHQCGAGCGSSGQQCGSATQAKGCDGSCGRAKKQTTKAVQDPAAGASEVYTQVYTSVYTLDQDIVPSEFRTKVGQPTRIEVLAKDSGDGCMRDILIQGLAETPQRLVAGETVSLSFTPKAKGTYLIVCAMNIPRGKVIVE